MTSNNPNNDLKAALTVAQRQVERLIRDHPDQFPTYTEGGRWHFTDDPWAPGWSSGFLTGMIWIIALHTQDPWWREQAEHYCHLLEPRAADEETHDIGFLFTPSWGRWHEVDPGPRTKEILVRAGRTMAKRFNQNGKYLRSFVDPGSTFVDIMMNVDIIFQAAELSGDAALAEVARQHALTSRRFLVRGDGSTIHEGWFNPDSGEFLRAATHQGFRSDSTWVRGLAWAIYGFGSTYLRTQDAQFLDVAKRCADFYIDHTGDRYIPPNDWDDPAPVLPYEASAASITAAGMLQLADILGANGEGYHRYASHIVARLSSPEFLGNPDQGWHGIIKHSTYHQRNKLGVDESVMWGDYYFVEALHRLTTSARR
ncbi:MAG: glycoside hydrolase family 88 protein [Paralcaligenes sp.]